MTKTYAAYQARQAASQRAHQIAASVRTQRLPLTHAVWRQCGIANNVALQLLVQYALHQ